MLRCDDCENGDAEQAAAISVLIPPGRRDIDGPDGGRPEPQVRHRAPTGRPPRDGA